MKNLMISLAVGTAALFVSSASAAPLHPTTMTVDSGVENVRMVCDESGRCWRERGQRRVIIERDSYNDSYNYDRGRRGPRYHDDRPAVGFQAPGVSIGVGVGGGRW